MTPQEAAQIRRYVNVAVRRAVDANSPENVDNIRRDLYTYEALASLLAPAGSANDVINIEADSDFILEKLAYQSDIAAAAYLESTRPIPLITIQIVDTGSGRQLMQNPIPVESLFGSGELPFVLSQPRKFERNSTIQIAFTNFDAAVTYSLRLAFIGYKVYGTA